MVKICGISNVDDAHICADAGADMLGLIVATDIATYGEKPYFLSLEQACHIATNKYGNAQTVLVTWENNVKRLAEMVSYVGVHALQCHGSTTSQDIARIKEMMPSAQIYQSIVVRDEQSVNEALSYDGVVDMVILDSAKNNTTPIGTHDWSISKEIVNCLKKTKVMLAGGLNIHNVSDGIARVLPYGVDVRNGVSRQDGTKDADLVKKFISLAKES